jgi:hypothetical protein
MYRLDHNQNLVELLRKLSDLRAEYPPTLYSARRLSFIRMVSRYIIALLQN